jgi:hypothetical protein
MKRASKIIYYNSADIRYSSFFLTGFQQNVTTFNYKFIVSKSSPPIQFETVEDGSGRDMMFSVCLFQVQMHDEHFFFCIDTRDSCELRKGTGFHLPLLRQVKYYFKVNFNADVIGSDPELNVYSNKIFPVPLFFPLRMPRLLPFLRIIPNESAGRTKEHCISRLKALIRLPSLQQIRRLRDVRKRLDLFFVSRFYQQEQHSKHNEFRLQVAKEIQKHRDVMSVVGFVSAKELPGEFAQFQVQHYPLPDYLRCIAEARLGIYVRGSHDCLSFKFGQLLAMGMPIIGQTIANNRRILYDNPYFHDQFQFDSPKHLVRAALRILKEPETLRKWSSSNSTTFDTKFTPESVTSDMLKLVLDERPPERTENL